MNWQPYPECRQSGVEWLDKVPVAWPVKRLRYCARINPSKAELRPLSADTTVSFVPMEAVGENGGLRLDQTKLLDEVSAGYTYFREGDVLVAKITPCFENGKGAIAEGLENGIGFGTTELHVVRPARDVDRRYLFYLTLGHAFRSIGISYMYGAGGQKRVPDEFVRDFRHAVPPLSIQRVIATFLDRETSRIDALITKKQRQIELLQEKRTALIACAVTRGLNSKGRRRSSGIEWLGEVPDHWNHRKLGYVAQMIGGCTPSKTKEEYWSGLIPWVSPKDMKRRRIGDSEDHISDRAIQETSIRVIDPPAVLIVVRGMILAHTFPVALTEAPVTVNQDIKALKAKPGLLAEYLAYLLEGISSFILSQVEDSAHGTKCLRTELWKNITVFVPEPSEQAEICAALDEDSLKIERVVQRIHNSIQTLREYRTGVISAAVTGKVVVPKEVA